MNGSIPKQLLQLQMRTAAIQAEIAKTEFETSTGGGALVIKMNGKREVLSVKVNPELLKEDAETVETVISTAIRNLNDQIEDLSGKKLKSISGGLLGGGFKLPGV